MAISRTAIDAAVKAAGVAVSGVLRARERGDYLEEPIITGALLEALRQALDGRELDGILWRARAFTSHGPGTEERRIGADLGAILTLQTPAYTVHKAFIAQCKNHPAGAKLTADRRRVLTEQCRKMISHTPAAFVFFYRPKRLDVVPALPVSTAATDGPLAYLGPDAFSRRTFRRFFEAFLDCHVGDPRLPSLITTATTTPRLRHMLHLTAHVDPSAFNLEERRDEPFHAKAEGDRDEP